MKKFLAAVMTGVLLTGMSVSAEDGITVYSNGNLVEDFGLIIEGRTLVPVRGVFEYLGYSVEWQADTKTAVLTSEDGRTAVSLTDGEDFFTVNGESFTPDVPQQIINGRFMLPLRSIGESIGADVQWDSETKTAYITCEEEDVEEAETEATTKTETIGNTTITSEVYVPFVSIEAIDPNELPEGTVEIEVN